MYHHGNREPQRRFGSTVLADRLLEVTHRTEFADADRVCIAAQRFFFLATADAEGRPGCSFKGDAPGFARVVEKDLPVFLDYEGNGMFKSLGAIRVNSHVGLLFIAMEDAPKRLRVNGRAEIAFDDPPIAKFTGRRSFGCTPSTAFRIARAIFRI